MGHDGMAMAELVVLGDRDLAGDQQGETVARFADLHQGLAGRVGARLAKPAQPLDLGGLEGREHLLATTVDKRGRGRGHARELRRPPPSAPPAWRLWPRRPG